MNKRRTYAGEFKAKVILELIRGPRNLSELASQYDLHPNQIKNWKSQFLRQAVSVLQDKRAKQHRDE